MSPVEASGRGHVGRAGLVSVVAVLLLFGGLWLVTVTLGNRDSSDLSLGSQTFSGRADNLADTIADGGPILLGDVSGRKDRDVYLQHLGDDPEKGWYAFAAQPLGKPRDCMWEWQEDEDLFRAKCDETLTAPADGEGLTQYNVTVASGRVTLDLNFDERQKTSTTTTAGN